MEIFSWRDYLSVERKLLFNQLSLSLCDTGIVITSDASYLFKVNHNKVNHMRAARWNAHLIVFKTSYRVVADCLFMYVSTLSKFTQSDVPSNTFLLISNEFRTVLERFIRKIRRTRNAIFAARATRIAFSLRFFIAPIRFITAVYATKLGAQSVWTAWKVNCLRRQLV